MSTDPLAEAERLAEFIDAAERDEDGGPWQDRIARAVLASDWLAAHDAQVRADERQKVAARLADEGTVEKVAEALNAADDAAIVETNFGRLTATYTDAARAALDVIAGLIGGEDE